MSCDRCGQPHIAAHGGGQACKGHKSETRGGAACRNTPLRGQEVCKFHGGAASQNKRKAAERVVDAKARQLMTKFGGPINTTPTEALLNTVRWTGGYVAWLRDMVEAIPNDDLVWGKTQSKVGGDDWGVTHKAVPNVWLALLGEWQDRLVKVCAEAIKAGVEERRVRLAEHQGEMVAMAIRAILADLHLTTDQQSLVSEVVPRQLRLILGGAA